MTIHDDAFKGSLNLSELNNYLSLDPSCLTRVAAVSGGPKAEMTPLALAVAAGRLSVVNLLLKDPPSRSDLNRGSERYSPLYYAITRTPQNSRIAIVNALLDAGADIKHCSSDEDDYTPLMLAISHTKDPELIHVLVDRDIRPNLREERSGKTAEGLAKELGLEKALWPKEKRLSSQGENVYWFLAVLLVLYMYAKTALEGTVKELLAVPQVKNVVKMATDKFNEDLNVALKDIGDHVGKGAMKLLDTQKQVGGKKPTSSAKNKSSSRPKSSAVPGGLGVPVGPVPISAVSTPASAAVGLPR